MFYLIIYILHKQLLSLKQQQCIQLFLWSCLCASGSGPSSSSSFGRAAVAWLFPSESSETLRQMRGDHGGAGGVMEAISDRTVKFIDEVWWSHWCRRFRAHKECKALFQAPFPSAVFYMFSLFVHREGKILFGLSWLKQIGLLVLARRGKSIHEEEEWEARLPQALGRFICLTVQRLGFVFCVGLGLCAEDLLRCSAELQTTW